MPVNQRIVCARAAREEFSEAYHRGIGDYRGARVASAVLGRHLASRLPDSLPLAPLAQLYDQSVAEFAWEGSIEKSNRSASLRQGHFQVMARKRPLQEEEKLGGAYDSVSLEGSNNAVVVHDGRVHRDGRSLYMVHSRFCLDRVFGESASNDSVYEAAAAPLLRQAASGRRSTLLLFGQTGTGKTYTSHSVLERLARELFGGVASTCEVLCYELAGTRGGRDGCFDLLAERRQVKCLRGEDGQVHVRGAKAATCSSAEELWEVLAAAFAWRSSECTERNDASSRSHAIIELRLPPPEREDCVDGGAAVGGVLRVVDLAGSERNYETQQHTRKMAERGGSINYSLLMLKECARIMHKNRRVADGAPGKRQHVPFRASMLTHLLHTCFSDEEHRTVVITTLSPSPTDVEHSLNSLQHVGMMRTPVEPGGGMPGAPGGGPKVAWAAEGGFGAMQGRGHALHSKLQDARASQLKLHAFNTEMTVGGSIQKKYDPEAVKKEAFIDPRWHREMNVQVEEDLWVLKEADAETVQLLTGWQEEKWRQAHVHEFARWDAKAVQDFVSSLELPGQARLPSTITGSQLQRLGLRGLRALCSDEATAAALHEALLGEQAASREAVASQRSKNAKITALGSLKVHAIITSAAGS